MKSLSMLVASLLMLGMMSSHASSGANRWALPADQIKQLEKQVQKPDKTKVQTSTEKVKTK